MIDHLAGRPILTTARMRETEDRAFACGHVTAAGLMEEAGLAIARQVHRLEPDRPVLVLAGPGNNGGDAYVAARHLQTLGREVRVVAFGPPKPGIAAASAAAWTGPVLKAGEQMPANHLLVDGVFGAGSVRPEPARGWSDTLIAQAAQVIAIDLPSWVDADTGDVRDWGRHLRADSTVALGALKPAHLLAADLCGQILFHDFGPEIIASAIENKDVEPFRWRAMERSFAVAPRPTDHKYRGLVTIVSGAMPGAARLAARGAAGAGAGYVVLLGDPGMTGPLNAVVHRPIETLDEALAGNGVVLLGPGLGRDDRARDLLDRALASRCALVLDGDALSLLGRDAAGRLRDRHRPGVPPTVLTPHEGEFARMFDTAPSKFEATQAAVQASGAIVIHKGHCTIIGKPSGELTATTAGSIWLATAGTGDVLAGAVAARWACSIGRGGQGSPYEEAVQLHARASQLAGPAFSADVLAEYLPRAMEESRWTRG